MHACQAGATVISCTTMHGRPGQRRQRRRRGEGRHRPGEVRRVARLVEQRPDAALAPPAAPPPMGRPRARSPAPSGRTRLRTRTTLCIPHSPSRTLWIRASRCSSSSRWHRRRLRFPSSKLRRCSVIFLAPIRSNGRFRRRSQCGVCGSPSIIGRGETAGDSAVRSGNAAKSGAAALSERDYFFVHCWSRMLEARATLERLQSCRWEGRRAGQPMHAMSCSAATPLAVAIRFVPPTCTDTR